MRADLAQPSGSAPVDRYADIVHATDFSAGATAAFHAALKLALASRARLDIVHVDTGGWRAGLEWEAFPRFAARSPSGA